MKKWIVILVTCCIVISLIAFIRATDGDQVIHSVQRVGGNFFWLLICTGIAYIFGTISWKYCLGDKQHMVSIARLFLIRHLGETVTLFNPASIVGGDTVKVIMLGNYGIEKKRVIASVIVSRLILIVSQLAFFMLTVVALLIQHSGFRFSNTGERALALHPFILAKTKFIRLKIARLLDDIPPLVRQNQTALTGSILFALLHWFFGALEFYFILKFLGLEVSILQALFIDLGVVFFKAAGAFIPGQIGIEEYGNKIMLMAIGIPNAEIWLSASILRRARQLVWIAFGIAVYFLVFYKRNFFHNV